MTIAADPALEGDHIAEVTTKLEAVRAWLDREGWSAALIESQSGFAWITGGGRSHISIGEAGGIASVLVTNDDAFLLTTNIELGRLLDEEAEGLPLTGIERPWHEVVNGGDLVRDLADPARTASDIGPSAPGLAALRNTLLPPEIERYRRLGADAAAAVETACRAAAPGDAELDVAGRVAHECARRDILALVNLVAADDRIARYRHPLPTPTRLERTLLVALTGRRHGLHASLTRMVSFGAPDDELAARHDAVTRIDARLLLESRPGISLSDVFARGREQYAHEGHADQWRLHHQGGLTGYAGREVFATPTSTHRLARDQALAWNPSVTRVKSEDTVFVTDREPEVLTRTGDWPTRPVELPVGTIERPALLVEGEGT